MKNNCPCCGPFPVLRLSHHHNSIIAADDYEAAVLTPMDPNEVAAQLIHRPSNCHWLVVTDSDWLLIFHTWLEVQLDCRHQDTTPRNRPTICRPTAILLSVSAHTWNTWNTWKQMILKKEEARAVEFVEFLRALLSGRVTSDTSMKYQWLKLSWN